MSILSSSEERRPVVIDAAVTEFARAGFRSTTVAEIAAAAKISSAYVFKMFPRKEHLFAAALARCIEQVIEALEKGADAAEEQSPDGVLFAMGGAYADLIADRALLMLQVHAQSAADIPEIGTELRRGLERVTLFAKTRSGAEDAAVQRFMAFGQLCHLIVTTGIDDSTAEWASILTSGIRHPA